MGVSNEGAGLPVESNARNHLRETHKDLQKVFFCEHIQKGSNGSALRVVNNSIQFNSIQFNSPKQ